MTPVPRKKLIEVAMPLEAINAEARRRKQKAPKGYPTSIHKYWAQRPVAACRSVLFAQLVDDPVSWPDRFSSDKAVEDERKRLHALMGRLALWESSGDEQILNEARWEIARSIAWARGEEPPSIREASTVAEYLSSYAPAICDPFCGAGSIPLEAQRLGLTVFASDLNPLAVLITKALVEFPRRYSGSPPAHEKGRTFGPEFWAERGAAGFASDVKHYSKLIRERATRILERYYPPIVVGKESLQPVAYFWVRTVRSPDPKAQGAHVPLASSFILSAKGEAATWIEPAVDASGRYSFLVKSGTLSGESLARAKRGTKAPGRGSNFACLLTGAAISGDYIKAEGMEGRLGARLMAVVAQSGRRRAYFSADEDQERAALLAADHPNVVEARGGWLSLPVPEKLTGGTCYPYGLTTFDRLYTDRQILSLTVFQDELGRIFQEIASDFQQMHQISSGAATESEGAAYARAVADCIALVIGRMALYGSTLCRWLTKDNALGSAIAQKGLEMTWDFAEANFLADSSASMTTCASNVAECLVSWRYNAGSSPQVRVADARFLDVPANIVFNTDPPYYDNIAYADLSDYFHPWHRRVLREIDPDLFRRISTNKQDEIAALSYRERRAEGLSEKEWEKLSPGRRAEEFFLDRLRTSVSRMSHLSMEEYPTVIYYAFRQQVGSEEGTSSAGWSTILQAIVDSGFAIDGTWPLRTELTSALKSGINALASSIVLVCRKRADDAKQASRGEFQRALRRELPDAIDKIRNAGVGPVDMQQSVIGPGMGVFSRYAKVLEDDDSPMTVKTALALINRVWEEIESELDAAFDPETQVALAWYASYGFDARASGELITLTTAKNTSDRALFQSGVFEDRKGKTALTAREDLPSHWTPATDRHLTVWECAQHTARVLSAADGGTEAAAQLVTQMGPRSAEARKLAYRLFEIATQRGWSAEALVYNELAEVWPKLEDLAADLAAPPASRPGQRGLFEETA